MDPNPQLRNFAVSAIVGAGLTATLKTTDATTDYIYVTGLILSVYTHVNAGTVTFQDSTPTTFAQYQDLTVAAGGNQGTPLVYDFGKRGYKLAQGKSLQAVSSGAGPAGSVVAYGYQSGS